MGLLDNQTQFDYYNDPNNYGNYQSLIRERKKELIHSMNTETKTFPKELLQ